MTRNESLSTAKLSFQDSSRTTIGYPKSLPPPIPNGTGNTCSIAIQWSGFR